MLTDAQIERRLDEPAARLENDWRDLLTALREAFEPLLDWIARKLG